MSALLSPINFCCHSGIMEGSALHLFKRAGNFMLNKFKDNIELIFLITLFISSLSAITPIS